MREDRGRGGVIGGTNDSLDGLLSKLTIRIDFHMNLPNPMRALFVPASAMVLAVAACSSPADKDASTTKSGDSSGAGVDAGPPAIKPAGEPTRGGDGTPIELATLGETDVAGARLKGELGCSFAADAATPPILVAKGNVATQDPARGIVKVGNTIASIAVTGGYDAIVDGANFFSEGLQLRVALTGAAPGDGESPPRPATLTLNRADGARRVIAGLWQCGP